MTLASLATATLAPLSWKQLGAVQPGVACIFIGLAGLLYGRAIRRVNRLHPAQTWSGRRVAAFYGGLAVTFVATECVIGVYDVVLFYDHMIQHLLLVMVAAPLLAMGAPIELLELSTTGVGHRLVERALRSKVAEIVAHPVVGFALYAFVIPIDHLTSFYNLTITNEAVHDLEHLVFLVVGYLFWRHVVAIEPSRHQLSPAVRLMFLMLALPVDTFTGLTLASASHELFPAYLHIHRTWGPSSLVDLHMGGDIMWVGGDSLMLFALVPVVAHWVRDEEQRTLELDRELDAALTQRDRAAHASGPGFPRTAVLRHLDEPQRVDQGHDRRTGAKGGSRIARGRTDDDQRRSGDQGRDGAGSI